jgi:hypothetical protein
LINRLSSPTGLLNHYNQAKYESKRKLLGYWEYHQGD